MGKGKGRKRGEGRSRTGKGGVGGTPEEDPVSSLARDEWDGRGERVGDDEMGRSADGDVKEQAGSRGLDTRCCLLC